MALKQSMSQKMLQKLSPQQIQLMKLLQVPTVELEQRIKEELEGNPALEEGREEKDEFDNDQDDRYDEEVSEAQKEFDINDYLDDDIPTYKTSLKNRGVDDEEKAVPLSVGESFHQTLARQIGLKKISDKQKEIAVHLIGNLDDSGYLRRSLESIVDDLAFSVNIMTTEEELEELLSLIQSLDPSGVGARDLRECLLIQLKRKKRSSLELKVATEIIQDYFEEFTKKHYHKILKKLDIDDDLLRNSIDEITRLNPKPGGSLKENIKPVQQITPDFMLMVNDGEIQLTINSKNAPELRVNGNYAQMLQNYANSQKTKKDKEAILFVKQKIDAAKWFIDAIKQRQQTLLLTINAIVKFQNDYFLTGDETKLNPMILKDISEMVNLDISTISRVANSKYIQTPYGTFLLKYFFSESLSTDSGEEVSTREVKKILEEAIEAEEKRKPFTDEKLATLLKEKGYNIARRTVAKYREQLGIPVARLRKEL